MHSIQTHIHTHTRIMHTRYMHIHIQKHTHSHIHTYTYEQGNSDDEISRRADSIEELTSDVRGWSF